MITRLEVDGFKTFSNFKMEFTPFTIIAGTNASGKSNIFDVLNLLSNLADKDIRSAFNNLRGDPEEQFTQFSIHDFSNRIEIAIELLVDRSVRDNWGEEVTLKYTRLRYEIHIEKKRNEKGFEDLKITYEDLSPLRHQEDNWVKNNIEKKYLEYWRPKVKTGKRGKPYILTETKNGKLIVKIPLDGKPGPGREFSVMDIAQSALSSVNSVEFPHIYAAKNEMLNWRFLQLNPEDLRKPSSRMAPGKVSHSGANLAAALYRLKQEDFQILNDISIELSNLLPNFTKVNVTEDVAENRFVISLTSDDGRIFSSRILSEGTLRILILCILKYDNMHKGIICFEEPENGIHPFRLNMMIQLLKGLATDFSDIEAPVFPLRQMIVNTHSASFIRKVLKNIQEYNELSVWFSKMISKASNDKSYSYKITKLIPVNYSNGQISLDFIEASEIAMTELDVEKYLETRDFENLQ
jgi:predicted ATPase